MTKEESKVDFLPDIADFFDEQDMAIRLYIDSLYG
jgi:hypothetical protein